MTEDRVQKEAAREKQLTMLAAIHDEADHLLIMLWDMALERYGLERTQETKERINWTISTVLDKHARPLGLPAISTGRVQREPIDTGLAMTFLATSIVYDENDPNDALHALVLAAEALGKVDVVGAMAAGGGQLNPSILEKVTASLLADRLTKLGKSGAIKRHAKTSKLQAWAVEKYRAKEWPSANKAAHALKDQVMEYGRTIDAHLTEENAQRTITRWFNESKKSV